MQRTLSIMAAAIVMLVLAADIAHAETYEIDGGKIRVRLVPDWNAAMVGEPLYLSLTIENLTSKDLFYGEGHTRNSLGRPDFIELTTVDTNGVQAEIPDPGPCFGGIFGPRRLKPGERHTKRLFLPHWAVITKPGTYTLTCKRAFEFFEGHGDHRQKPVRTVETSEVVTLTIDPLDSAKVPAMIQRWERVMRAGNGDASEEAARALAHITDPRVLPALDWGTASGRYSLIFTCVRACAKFEEDLALLIIKDVMRIPVKAIKNASNAEVAQRLVMNLRHAAAHALGVSRHPKALEVLRTFADDPQYEVRLDVVQRFGKRGTAKDIELLRSMKDDEHPTIRSEVERYLKMIESK